MRISTHLAVLALRQLVGGACKIAGLEAGAGAVDGTVRVLLQRFLDHSSRLTEALEKSNDRTWRALEVALAGDSIWERCKLVLAPGEDKAFRALIQPFLTQCSLPGKETFRKYCLAELRAARKDGLLTEGTLDPSELAKQAGTFARFTDPQALLDAELAALGFMGEELKQKGYVYLAEFVSLRPDQGETLLVMAARYFFRREVETDQVLFQSLTFTQLEQVQEGQRAAFDALWQAITQQGDQLTRLLSEVQATVIATHGVVLDVREEQQRQSERSRDIYQAVLDLQSRMDVLHREVKPSDSLSLRNDHERTLVKQLVSRYRSLPEVDRQSMPALLNAIGKLEVAAGDYKAACADFAKVSHLTSDAKARAEAHFNTYRAALEARDWTTALNELLEAVRLDGARFAPFPVEKYRPKRILGAGGFGTAFLCEHRFLKAPVVLKTLADDDLDRGIDAVFTEAQTLRQLDHPAIIRLLDCGFGSPDGESRPYLVMDYFEGETLEDSVHEQTLAVDEFLPVARQIASGLVAAHGKGILHRDVKPANLLIQRGSSASTVKLIDFGLALKHTGRETMLATSKTLTGNSIAGTIEYAAPEQMGKLPGVEVCPASDVYGFARTSCYALFRTPQPLMRHWKTLPQELAELLESCLEEQPKNRPQSFADVLAILDRLAGVHTPAPTASVPTGEEPRRRELATLTQTVVNCTRCPTLVRSRSQTVFGIGAVDPELFLIGEAPGAEEDRTGKPFVGPTGQVLASLLSEAGLTRENVYLTNLIKCRPPTNRKPDASEIQNCRDHLAREIEIVRPKGIVCLGGAAAQGLLNTTEFIGKLRGRLHDYRGIPVLCTYHPAFLLPNRSPEKRGEVVGDLKILLRRVRA